MALINEFEVALSTAWYGVPDPPSGNIFETRRACTIPFAFFGQNFFSLSVLLCLAAFERIDVRADYYTIPLISYQVLVTDSPLAEGTVRGFAQFRRRGRARVDWALTN